MREAVADSRRAWLRREIDPAAAAQAIWGFVMATGRSRAAKQRALLALLLLNANRSSRASG
jgi:hypothetical protein